MGRLPVVDDGSFESRVERADGLTVVEFGAAWCGPCRVTTPLLEALAEEYGGRVRILSLDVDLNPATPARFGVRGLPTTLIFRDGVVVDRIVGAVPRRVLEQALQSQLTASARG